MAGSSTETGRPASCRGIGAVPTSRAFPCGPLLAAVAILFAADTSRAHPAHAKPVNYPYIVGFERFHSSLDDDDYLAEGGLILLNELNCVACHAPPTHIEPFLRGVEATDLEGVATRLDPINLEIMIRNPRFVKRDTTMPSLFSGPDRDLAEVEALKHFLATLEVDVPDYPRGDIGKGRSFYHRIGCASCHAPEVGYRPVSIPENAEIELAGLPSVPMNLADLYDLDSLTHFLLDPNRHRPSGRMPDFRLSVTEAADLAAYLKAGPGLRLPDNLTEALNGREAFAVREKKVAVGREIFRKKNCQACHSLPERGIERMPVAASPLATLPADSEEGCLAPRPPGGAVPFYGLDAVQKRAIRTALARLDHSGDWDPAKRLDWRMKQLNCYACHEREGRGGAETAREVYFGFAGEKAIELGRAGHLPPSLDRVGARLRPEALERMLSNPGGGDGTGRVRSYLVVRMPTYRPDAVEPLASRFASVDRAEKASEAFRDASGTDRGHGAGLFRERGCSDCHSAGTVEENSWPGIDLTPVTGRIRPGYFERLLRDSDWRHPPRIAGREEDPPPGDDEAAALWNWLESLPQAER